MLCDDPPHPLRHSAAAKIAAAAIVLVLFMTFSLLLLSRDGTARGSYRVPRYSNISFTASNASSESSITKPGNVSIPTYPSS